MDMRPARILLCATGRRGEDYLRLLAAQDSLTITLFDPKTPTACSKLANNLKIPILKTLPDSPFAPDKFDIALNTLKTRSVAKLLANLCIDSGIELIQQHAAEIMFHCLEAKAELNLYKNIVDHLPFTIFVKNDQSKYIFMSEKMLKMCKTQKHLSRTATITDYDLWPKKYAGKYRRDDREIIKNGKQKQIIETYPNPDGDIQTVKTTKIPIQNNEKPSILGVFTDITKEHELQAAIDYRNELNNLLTKISTGFINLPFNEMDKGINNALSQIGAFCDADRTYVYLCSEKDNNLLINTHNWCKPGLHEKYKGLRSVQTSDFPAAHKIIIKNHVFKLPEDFKKLTKKEQAIYTNSNITALLQVPMIYNGRLIGFFGIDSPRPGQVWTENIIQLMQTAGEMLTQVLLQQRIAKALRHEKKFVEDIIDTANVIILLLDKSRRIIRFNHYMEELSGYTSREMQGKDWFSNFIPQDIRADILPLYKRAVINGIQTKGNINPIKTKSGKLRYIEWYDTTIKDPEGNIEGLLAIGHDITERLKAENALKESEKKLRLFAENSADIIWTLDNDLNYTYVSPACTKLLGYTPQEMLSLENDSMRTDKDFRRAAKRLLEDEEQKLPAVLIELEQKRKNNENIWTEIVINQSIDDNGLVIGLSGITRNISERKEAAAKLNEYRFHLEELVRNKTKQLRESNEFNRTIIENIPSAIMVLDRNFNIETSNSKLSKLFQTYDNLNGRSLQSIIRCYREPDYKRLFVTLNKVLQGKLNSAEIEIILPINKNRQSLRCHISTMLPRREKLLVVIEDISQHKSLEQHLLFAERLAATGRLAASFAHEINNPLQGMATHLDILFEDRDNSRSEQESYKCIRENIDRIAHIVKQLMHTKKASEQEYTTICIDDLVNKVVTLMENSIRVKGIDLKYNPIIQHILVHGSDTQLHQAILNLVINAMDSMEKGGELTISVTTDKRNVYVIIKDTGKGIKTKDIELIFDPFFTKKKTGGSGLGLFVCQNIALMHKGNISVESKYTKGSTFTLSLPLKTSQLPDSDTSSYITPGKPMGNMPDFLR